MVEIILQVCFCEFSPNRASRFEIPLTNMWFSDCSDVQYTSAGHIKDGLFPPHPATCDIFKHFKINSREGAQEAEDLMCWGWLLCCD